MALPGDEAPAGIALSNAPKALKPADHDKVAIFQGRDSIWIPGNDKYHMKKPALNNRTIITRQISGEYAFKAPSTILLF